MRNGLSSDSPSPMWRVSGESDARLKRNRVGSKVRSGSTGREEGDASPPPPPLYVKS